MTKSKGLRVRRPPETKAQAIELRSKGMSRKDISETLKVPIVQIHKWFKGLPNLPEEVRNANLLVGRHSIMPEYAPDLTEDILKLYKTGLTRNEIAKELNIDINKVRSDIQRSKVRLTEEEKAEHKKTYDEAVRVDIAKLRNQGKSKEAIAKELNLNENTVKYLVAESGIKLTKEQIKDNQRSYTQEDVDLIKTLRAQREPPLTRDEIIDYIRNLGFDVIINDRTVILPKEIDIYVPEAKLAIEYDGLYWHCAAVPGFYRGRTMEKALKIQEKNINFLHIFEDEWWNPVKNKLLKAMIRFRLKKFNGIKLNARDLKVEQVEPSSLKEFFETNHIDGFHQGSKESFALIYENKPVIAVTVRKNSHGEQELGRLATDYNFMVRGGAGKLINQIKGNLISFSNNRLSLGNVYKSLGFKEITQTFEPGYWYTDGTVRINRWRCQRINEPEILAQYPTEEAQALGGVFSSRILNNNKPLYRIEDCGHRKWLRES
jgi:orotate phosphoribosyltransferase-like protein